MNVLDQFGWREIALGLLSMWIAVLTFFGKRELKRLDEKADGEDVKELLRQLNLHSEDDKELQTRIMESLSDVREHVARISGKLGL